MLAYDIKIFSPDFGKRSFIAITIDGKRYKEYNGNRININIKPNNAKNIKERNQLLKQLEFEYRKRLEDGTYQRLKSRSSDIPTKTYDLLNKALHQKLRSNLNPHYAKALENTCKGFLKSLPEKERSSDINVLKIHHVQDYLDKYRSTPPAYMSKRRELSSLLGYIKNKGVLHHDLIRQTDKLKIKATLHKVYRQEQLNHVFDYLKQYHENLYLCALITYGCLLRPHIEVRNLKGSHFKNDCTEIHLAGGENKSGRIRVVYVPDYVRLAIQDRVSTLAYDDNLFSLEKTPYNEYYFKTAWKRQFKIMHKLGIVEDDQTMYSFRHTAAVNVYKQTKDLHLLQQLLGHSSMIVTLKYLRGLGVHNMEELKDVMPQL